MRRKIRKALRDLVRGPAPRIAFFYLAFGVLWISVSDSVLAALVKDVEMLSTMQTYKGWAYVVVTAFLVYLLVWGYFTRLMFLQDCLREREEAFRTYVRFLPVGAFRVDPESNGRLLMVNQKLVEMLGYGTPEALAQIPAEQLFAHEEDSEAFELELLRGEALESRQVELRRADGSQFWGSVTVRTMTDESGAVYFDGVLLDITDRKAAEDELRRLWMAVEHAAESIMIGDPRGRILYANPAFETVSGYSREEAVGRNVSILRSGKHDNAFYRDFWKTLKRGEVWRGRFINRRRDGGYTEEETTVSPVRDARGQITHYVSVARDVTHEALLERDLRQAQKMEAVGRMAGGIAHDFNNILSAIIGFSDLALSDLDPTSRAAEDIGEVLTAAERARDIVGRILTFSRQAQPKPGVVRPAEVVEEALVLVRSFVPATIEIRTRIEHTCRSVLAEATQLHQVVMNLVTNACHAMGQSGGMLTVAVEEAPCPSRREAADSSSPAGECVCITVADTGHGMDAETQQLIFDPYFTTKGTGEGTGLGLATVHAIVQHFGGTVEVDSLIGKGTAFRVYLPVTDATPEPESKKAEAVQSGQGQHLLVVDDEPTVLTVTRRQLERSGYVVTASASASQALSALQAAPDHFSAVITDQTMPGITGIEFARQCRELRPDIPVILVTGHGTSAMRKEARNAGVHCVIAKPVNREELTRALHEVLDGSG